MMGWKGFAVFCGAMLLLVGIQTGIVVMPRFSELNSALQVGIIMGYWAFAALIFSLVTNLQIKKGYDIPMRMLSSAAKRAAEGDFSVYVKPPHNTPDKYDYIDVMFTDFNVMVQELGALKRSKMTLRLMFLTK